MRHIIITIALLLLATTAYAGCSLCPQTSYTATVPYIQTTDGYWTGVAVRCEGGDVRMDIMDGAGVLVDYQPFWFEGPCTIKYMVEQAVDAGQLVFTADQPFVVTVGIGNEQGWTLETYEGE